MLCVSVSTDYPHLLLVKRYNLFKVLACSNTFFHLPLFCATFFQLRTFMLFISSKTSSSQRILGIPIGLLDMRFHLLIFCTLLSSTMRSTWPNHCGSMGLLIQRMCPASLFIPSLLDLAHRNEVARRAHTPQFKHKILCSHF